MYTICLGFRELSLFDKPARSDKFQKNLGRAKKFPLMSSEIIWW